MISDVLHDAALELETYLDEGYPAGQPADEVRERVLDLRARMVGLSLELDTIDDGTARYAVLRKHSVVGRNLRYASARYLAEAHGGEVYLPFASDWIRVPVGAGRAA